MTRRDLALQALLVFVVALLVRILAASIVVFPQPEDTAYYVGVARNLLDGHGLTSNAIWSFQTPPLSFPRPAFEVWLPLPTFLFAIPLARRFDRVRTGGVSGTRIAPTHTRLAPGHVARQMVLHVRGTHGSAACTESA